MVILNSTNFEYRNSWIFCLSCSRKLNEWACRKKKAQQLYEYLQIIFIFSLMKIILEKKNHLRASKNSCSNGDMTSSCLPNISEVYLKISQNAKYFSNFRLIFVQNFDGLCFELGALINTSSGRVRPPWANCHTRADQPPLPISNYYYLSVVKFTIILSLLTVKYPDLLVCMKLNNF